MPNVTMLVTVKAVAVGAVVVRKDVDGNARPLLTLGGHRVSEAGKRMGLSQDGYGCLVYPSI